MSNNREYMRIYMLERYYRRRAVAIQQLGGRCVDCGSTEDLEFDHEDRLTKSFSMAKILSGGSEARVQEELAKCVLRCHPHHIEKSRQAGDLGVWNVNEKHCCGQVFRIKPAYAGHCRWHARASLV